MSNSLDEIMSHVEEHAIRCRWVPLLYAVRRISAVMSVHGSISGHSSGSEAEECSADADRQHAT